MSAIPTTLADYVTPSDAVAPADHLWRRALRSGRIVFGGGVLLVILLICVSTLVLTLDENSPYFYQAQADGFSRVPPPTFGEFFSGAWKQPIRWFGYDALGRSIFARCLLGGTISLSVGIAAAAISVVLGVSIGMISGFKGGWIDSTLMRFVDILYGLPYVLMVILLKIALEPKITELLTWTGVKNAAVGANLIVMFSAIGLVSWLTMARVVRGQVLSIRSMPYIEACRAMGLPQTRIFTRHVLPNLIGPVIVYATLTVPLAILQESFLSFLGVGVNLPLPTWGSLASEGVTALSPVKVYWWMLLFPCILLVVTLLSLNYMGDGLRDVFDPKREAAKI